MGLTIQTLDFEIHTPDNKTLHYSGPISLSVPSTITIEPSGEYMISITLPLDYFGYDFTIGQYSIKAIYNSTFSSGLIWTGKLESNIESFAVIQ